MRTEQQKREFARECLEIEKSGGDVLEHIRKEWPSYSPRATWYNLKREYLKRKQTSAGSRRTHEKEEDGMKRDRESTLESLVKVISEKGDPIAWLNEQGYKNPTQAWINLRAWANETGKNQGRLPAHLGKYYAEIRRAQAGETPEPEKPEEIREEPENAEETAVFKGKEYEKMKPVPEDKPIVAKIVIDDKAEPADEVRACECTEKCRIYPIGGEKIRFKPKQVTSAMGTWEYNPEKDQYAFSPWMSNGMPASVIVLTLKEWLNLAAEIPEAIRILARDPGDV